MKKAQKERKKERAKERIKREGAALLSFYTTLVLMFSTNTSV